MAAKTWRLVVTELGGSTALHEVTVEAANWMTALTNGRKEIGEDGGVPTGASCAVAPDGKVTIHDPMARRTYTLTPDVAKSFQRNKPSGPRIPGDEAAPEAPKKPAAPKKKVPKKTIAYAVAPLAGPGGQVSVGNGPAPSPQPAPPQPGGAAAAAAPAQQAASQPVAQAQPAPQPQPEPAQQKPAGAPQPAQQNQAVAPQPQPPTAQPARSSADPKCELLSERGQDPTPESPLHYRERTYVVAEGTSRDDAELVIRQRFAELRGELESAPPGKFFNLAVFDHRWEGRPRNPPVATLQWKDWRGEPEVAFPLEAKLKERAARKAAAPGPQAEQPASQTASKPAPQQPAPQQQPSQPPAAQQPAQQQQPSQPPAAQQPAQQQQPSQPPAAQQPAQQQQPSQPPAAQQPPAPQPQAAPAQPAGGKRPPVPAGKRTSTDEQDARLAQAFEATQDLFFLSTPVEGLDFTIRLLEELVPCEATTACLYDINTHEFRFVALSGPGAEERKGEAIPAHTGLLGMAAERIGAATIVGDVASDHRYDPGVDGRVGLEPKNALYVALHHQGRLLGMLQLLNRQKSDAFSDDDGEVVGYVGKQLAEFLFQARIAQNQGARL